MSQRYTGSHAQSLLVAHAYGYVRYVEARSHQPPAEPAASIYRRRKECGGWVIHESASPGFEPGSLALSATNESTARPPATLRDEPISALAS